MLEEEKCFVSGIAVGVALTIIIWIVAAGTAEDMKVANGYLTYKTKTYTVSLYDELDTPPKPASKPEILQNAP